MRQIVLEIPDRSMEALSDSPEAAGKELRLAAAMKLYEIGRLTSGGAAELAGVARVECRTWARSGEYRAYSGTDNAGKAAASLAEQK